MSAVPPPPPDQPPVVQTTQAGFTATCPQCRQPVHPKAYKCPYCKTRLRTSEAVKGCLIVIIVVIGVVVLVSVFGKSSSHPESPSPTVHADPTPDPKWAASAAGKLCSKHPGWEREACETIVKKQIYAGMTAEQVRVSWGKPEHINSTITGNRTSEQWVYRSGAYVYFDEGIMTSLQQQK
jgi:hypothetical protein